MSQTKPEEQSKKQIADFEIVEYPHHELEHCRFEIFTDGKLIASFEPDRYGDLHICKNPGGADMAILHKIAEELEALL